MIPLPMHNMLDFIVWSDTKNGLFTICFSYLKEWNKRHRRKLEYTNGKGRSKVKPIWDKISKLACSTKVKIFIWCMLHGTLPCRVTLANRQRKVSPIRPSCSNGQRIRNTCCFCIRWQKLCGISWGYTKCLKKIDRAGEAVLELLLLM